MTARPDPTLVLVPDGRRLAVDDVGDASGDPVLYLHGTPDSRLSRHPDDRIAAALGIRLLAVDRPGCGRSDADPGRTLASVADDLIAVLDALGLERTGVVAWSGGAPYGVALAALHPDRVSAVVLTAPVVPLTALADDPSLAAVAEGRAALLEMAEGIDPLEVGREVAPYLVPDPATPESVAAQQAEEGGDGRRRDLADVPGGAAALVAATVESVSVSLDGLIDDVATSLRRPDVDLTATSVPVRCLAGGADQVAPSAFARWWVDLLPDATLTVENDRGHALHLPHWSEIIAEAGGRPVPG